MATRKRAKPKADLNKKAASKRKASLKSGVSNTRSRVKPLAKVVVSPNNREIVPDPDDGLPPYHRYVEFQSAEGALGKKCSRMWFDAASKDEIKDVIAKGCKNIGAGNPIVPFIESLGFSDVFARQLARLIYIKYKGIRVQSNSASATLREIIRFAEYLAILHCDEKESFLINDLCFDDFLSYKQHLEKNSPSNSIDALSANLRKVITIFSINSAVPCNEEIKQVIISQKGKKKAKPAYDHTSSTARDEGYSRSVMYQLFCQFIVDFEKRIEFLKEYEDISESELDELTDDEWIRPGAINEISETEVGGRSLPITKDRALMRKWLSDEKYYPIINKHILFWHKVGAGDFTKNKIRYLQEHGTQVEKENTIKYLNWESNKYGVVDAIGCDHTKSGQPIKHSCKEILSQSRNQFKYQASFSLVCLIMIVTGKNRSVVLSWDSKVDGESILDKSDALFKKFKKEGEADSPSIIIDGCKTKVGKAGKNNLIRTVIPKNSYFYKLLKDYERYIKTDFDGKFFEIPAYRLTSFALFSLTAINQDGEDYEYNSFYQRYPVKLEDGSFLMNLESRKFRKVFLGEKMFELMASVKNAAELGDKLRDVADHGDIDTTLSSYIFKTADPRDALDITFAMITGDKIVELCFAGTFSNTEKGKKNVYLCKCKDPLNPSHKHSIAEECRRYDLCLGCFQSIVSKKHLPYICLRILQYEEKRADDPRSWSSLYEDRWTIAHDCLNKYIDKDRKDGKRLVEEAWHMAKNNKVWLPSIIDPEIK